LSHPAEAYADSKSNFLVLIILLIGTSPNFESKTSASGLSLETKAFICLI
jgi:hypothetical protein